MADTPKGGTDTPTGETGPAASPDMPPPAARPATAEAKSDKAAAAPAARGGGGRRVLVLVAIVALVAVGGYASYPWWRGEVEPLAAGLGITLPAADRAEPAAEPPVAQAPLAETPLAETPLAETPVAETPLAETPVAEAPSADVPVAATPPAEPVATAAAVEALERRIAELERAAAEPPAVPEPDTAALDRLSARLDAADRRLNAVADEIAIVREGLASSGGDDGLGPLAAQMSERLQRLAERLDAVEQADPAPAAAPERVDALQRRIESLAGGLDAAVHRNAEDAGRLETRIAALAGSLDAATNHDAETIAALRSQIAGIESRLDGIAETLGSDRGAREHSAAFLLAANQLAAAASGSGGFDAELAALRVAAADVAEVTAALDTLDAHAAGVPSLAVLRARFADIAAAALGAQVAGTGEGVISQAMTRVAGLVTLRRTGSADGDGLDAALNRAEAALAAGDLPAAVDAMRTLQGDPATVTAGWLADAEARAAVDAAVRRVQAAALARLAGG